MHKFGVCISNWKNLVVGIILFPPLLPKPEFNPLVLVKPPIQAPEALIDIAQGAIVIPQFPDMTANYQKMEAEKAALEAQRLEAIRAAEEAEAARLASLYVPPPVVAPVAPAIATRGFITPIARSGGLNGSYGYAFAGGNCVNQVPMGLRAQGNPISWPALTQTPYIGAAVLFYYNHTGRVTGIWSNGDIEIAHENWSGTPVTRFPASTFRGFR